MKPKSYFYDILLQLAGEQGIRLSPSMANSLITYKHLLIAHNKNINLTSITDPYEIILKHFIDSLFVIKFFNLQSPVIDIGTGAGLPGIPLSIVMPTISFTLVDTLQKRINFLNSVKEQLQLNNVIIIKGRSEDLAHDNEHNLKEICLRESFLTVVSRAVAPLYKLAELCLPFVIQGGIFIAYKGINTEDEVLQAKNAINALGGSIEDIIKYKLPSINKSSNTVISQLKNDITHSLIIIRKTSPTSPLYPRKPNKIKNKPIL